LVFHLISIVICSVKPELLAALKQNIAVTVGVAHEIIAVDNRNSGNGLCHVYNQAAALARFDTLCFMHEDIAFLSKGWGLNVLAHFSEQQGLGLLGVAGSRYKSGFPSGWSTGSRRSDCQSLFHREGNGTLKAFHNAPPSQEAAEGRSYVCVLDGLWLCVRRSLWDQVRFDEAIPGFHFYDLDFSLRCHRRMAVAVVYDIQLTHFSMGHFDHRWLQGALDYHRKQKHLPASLLSSTELKAQGLERKTLQFWIKTLRKQRFPRYLRTKWLLKTPIWRYPRLWLQALKLLALR
jgi:hypothetical protein